MDWTEIIVAAFAALSAIIGSFLANHTARVKDNAHREAQIKEKWQAEAEERAKDEAWRERVEAKLDEHNNYGQKFGQVAESFADLRIDIAEIKTEIRNIKESR